MLRRAKRRRDSLLCASETCRGCLDRVGEANNSGAYRIKTDAEAVSVVMRPV